METPNCKQAVSQIKACRAYFQSGVSLDDKQKALQGFEAGISTLKNTYKQIPDQSIFEII